MENNLASNNFGRLPVFAGKDNENIEHWLIKYEDATIGLSDEQRTAKLSMALEDSAFEWYFDRRKNDALPKSFYEIRCLLLERFKLKSRDVLIRMSHNESVKQYVANFESLQCKLASLGATKELITNYFVNGLRDEIYRSIILIMPCEYQSVKEKALMLDTLPNYDNFSQSTHLENVAFRAQQVKREAFTGEKLELYLNNACFRCKKTGHKAYECPTRMSNPSRNLKVSAQH